MTCCICVYLSDIEAHRLLPRCVVVRSKDTCAACACCSDRLRSCWWLFDLTSGLNSMHAKQRRAHVHHACSHLKPLYQWSCRHLVAWGVSGLVWPCLKRFWIAEAEVTLFGWVSVTTGCCVRCYAFQSSNKRPPLVLLFTPHTLIITSTHLSSSPKLSSHFHPRGTPQSK